jgi:hypothetical protein
MNLEELVANRLIYWSEQICSQVRDKWTSQTSPQAEGQKEIHVDPPEVTPGLVIATIVASGGSAWMVEFGKGSLMDITENPYIAQYLSSSNFNSWRGFSSRMPIMGRSAGEYTDLDGNTQVSSGKMAGLDLERDGKPEFQPSMPMHTIETELEFTWPLIQADIEQTIANAISEELIYSLTMDIYI